MTKIDIYSGFLGAGKTTLIKKLIKEAYSGEKLVLIENEFGEIGVDSGFLSEAGINITEMNSGCICCSLVGDFSRALEQVISDYKPDRIIIEPSGVGKLSDVITAVKNADIHDAQLNFAVCVADAKKCKMYMKNFGEFYNNQIENALAVILSHTSDMPKEKLEACVAAVREHNNTANIITTDWDSISGAEILAVIEGKNTLNEQIKELQSEMHHHHDDDCGCVEHHHHDDECGCGEHHHHHDDDCGCGEHHHHDDDCGCGEHHHHHADEVFASWGRETVRSYTKDEIKKILSEIENQEKYGMVLRAKGIVSGENGWIHFDYTPGDPDIRDGGAAAIGRFCVIGSNINEKALEELFLN